MGARCKAISISARGRIKKRPLRAVGIDGLGYQLRHVVSVLRDEAEQLGLSRINDRLQNCGFWLRKSVSWPDLVSPGQFSYAPGLCVL